MDSSICRESFATDITEDVESSDTEITGALLIARDNVEVVNGWAVVIDEDTVVTVVVPLDSFEEGWTLLPLLSSFTLSAFAAKIHLVVCFRIGCLRRVPQGLPGSSVKLVLLVLKGEGSRLDDNGRILSTMTFSGSEMSSPLSNCKTKQISQVKFKILGFLNACKLHQEFHKSVTSTCASFDVLDFGSEVKPLGPNKSQLSSL